MSVSAYVIKVWKYFTVKYCQDGILFQAECLCHCKIRRHQVQLLYCKHCKSLQLLKSFCHNLHARNLQKYKQSLFNLLCTREQLQLAIVRVSITIEILVNIISFSEEKKYSSLEEEWPMVLWWHLRRLRKDVVIIHSLRIYQTLITRFWLAYRYTKCTAFITFFEAKFVIAVVTGDFKCIPMNLRIYV